jgi:hypothetical protein
MSKNPFEIRADMLAMAKDYMDKQYELNVSFAKDMLAQGKQTAEEFQKVIQPYSVEELMKKAQELYSFVSKKD